MYPLCCLFSKEGVFILLPKLRLTVLTLGDNIVVFLKRNTIKGAI